MEKIKESEAKKICETYGYDYAIIIGVRASDGAGATATYGMTKKLCRKAAQVKDFIAAQIFGPEATDDEAIEKICKGWVPENKNESLTHTCHDCKNKHDCFNF